MRKVLVVLFLGTSIWVGVVLAQAPKASGKKTVRGQLVPTPDALAVTKSLSLLKAAELYLELEDKESAEAQALAALKVAQTDGLADATRNKITEDVRILLKRLSKLKQAAANKTIQDKAAGDERAMRKHLAQIQEAEYLLSQGKPAESSKILQSVLNETENTEVRKQAIAVSSRVNSAASHTWSTFVDHVAKIFWWVIDVILVGLVLLGIYALLKWGRKINAAQYRGRWTVNPIDDKSELGMAGAIIESLNRWRESRVPASAGLLKLGDISVPTVPRIEDIEPEIDLGAALADLKLEVGTVSIGGIAKAAGSIRAWFTALRPSLGGSAAVSGEQVVVRLTRRSADGTRNSVTASAEKTKSTYAAEAASFKMYYLIAKDTNVSEAESANKLREGMSLLREYLLGRGPDKLTGAYENFRDAHIESPTLHEAYLYEGIALDLLERHDDAIMTFQYLAEPSNGFSEELRKKARYNEAVCLFRKYTRAGLESAIRIFDELVELPPEPTMDALAASPVKALAYAAKANAIAHRVIFWQEYFYSSPEKDDQRIIFGRKSAKGPAVRAWFEEAEQIANILAQVHTRVAGNQGWDEVTRRQLKWAIDNARGNNFLNYARSFLQQPHVVGQNEEEQRREYLDQAFRAFRNSEMVLTPGVETLANLGTVLIELSRQAEARSYLERIIELNPQYEYAYYRLAESWEKENKKDKVVETLRAFARVKTPGIRSFKALYEKYATELALG